MAEPLFNPDKCDVASVQSVDFDFVSDCSIAAPPPPIFDCPLPVIPPDPPPPPCPEFQGSLTLEAAFKGCPEVGTEPSGALTFTRVDNDPCRFLVDLDLNIPIPLPPCPDITGGDVTINRAYDTAGGSCGAPTGALTVTKNVKPYVCNTDSATCEYTIDLDLKIPIPQPPCPDLKTGDVNLAVGYEGCVSGPTAAFTITKNVIPGTCDTPQSCQFLFDLDLAIPVPKPPCPDIKAGDVSVNVGYDGCVSGAGGALTITKNTLAGNCETGNSCQFTVDLDLNIPIPQPPCPVINVTGAVNYGTAVSAAALAVSVDTTSISGPDCNTPPTCEFDINIELDIPKPCPEINVSGSVIVTPGREEPTLVAGVVKSGTDCKFDIDINLELPPPPPCPEITGTISVYKAENPTGTLAITATPPVTVNDPCTFDFDIDIGVPDFCTPEFSTKSTVIVTPGRNEPSAAFTVVGPGLNDCKYEFDLQLEFPAVRPCPTITGAINVYKANTPTGALTITPTVPESNTEACVFDLDIDIGVPDFCTPEFSTKSSVIVTPGRNEPSMAFSVKGPGASDCKYELDLQLEFPAIRPCPTITGAVNVYTANAPTGALVITPTTPTSNTEACSFDLDIAIGVPPACVPEIDITGTIVRTLGREEPWIKTTANGPGASDCKYNLNVQIELPMNDGNELQTGLVACGWTGCGYDPTCVITISTPDENNIQKLNVDIRIPKPPIYLNGKISLGDYGSGVITIDPVACKGNSDDCCYEVNAKIELATNACDGSANSGY